MSSDGLNEEVVIDWPDVQLVASNPGMEQGTFRDLKPSFIVSVKMY